MKYFDSKNNISLRDCTEITMTSEGMVLPERKQSPGENFETTLILVSINVIKPYGGKFKSRR